MHKDRFDRGGTGAQICSEAGDEAAAAGIARCRGHGGQAQLEVVAGLADEAAIVGAVDDGVDRSDDRVVLGLSGQIEVDGRCAAWLRRVVRAEIGKSGGSRLEG